MFDQPRSVTRAGSRALLAVVVAALLAPQVPAQNDAPSVTINDKKRVYYPSVIKKGAAYKKPAVLETSKVFMKIAEWREIIRKGLTETDAEYHLLLKTANKKFNRAVRAAQKSSGYDIIAEVGAITCKNCVADDITKKTITELPDGEPELG